MGAIPLPSALSGELVTRPITIDRALLYLVTGSLEYVTDYARFAETGSLTVDQVKLALSDMLWTYLTEEAGKRKVFAGMFAPYGGAVPLPTDMTDAGWLPCDGTTRLIADYPDLYAAIGHKFTNGSEPGGEFRLPEMANRLPMGTNFNAQVGDRAGADSVALSVANLPPHTHTVPRSASSTAGTGSSAAQTGSVATTNVTGSTGSGTAVNILNPVVYLHYVIMSAND